MIECKRAERRMGTATLPRLGELPPNRIPKELKEPAKGRFPHIERQLAKQGTSVPDDWKVENFLSVAFTGATSLLRLEAGNAPDTPEEVCLILDPGNYAVNEYTGKRGYGMVDFEVGYHDGTRWYGRARMPRFYKMHQAASGMPWSMFNDSNPQDSFGEANFVDEAGKFTALGRHLVSFIAGSIASYNQVLSYQANRQN